MTDDPQTASITARRRPLLLALLAGLGSAAAIGIMEWLSVSADYPLAIIPFATSIVLVIGLPDAEPSQPRALVGGHLVATIAGLVVVKLAGPSAWAAAVAVGLAVAAMMLTGTMHPPAGINPLLVVINNLSWPFLLMPVLAGALLLAAFTFAWHRLSGRSDWPRRWW
ncbi:MAG: HPP family protein [Pseudomonadota bacterium]